MVERRQAEVVGVVERLLEVGQHGRLQVRGDLESGRCFQPQHGVPPAPQVVDVPEEHHLRAVVGVHAHCPVRVEVHRRTQAVEQVASGKLHRAGEVHGEHRPHRLAAAVNGWAKAAMLRTNIERLSVSLRGGDRPHEQADRLPGSHLNAAMKMLARMTSAGHFMTPRTYRRCQPTLVGEEPPSLVPARQPSGRSSRSR